MKLRGLIKLLPKGYITVNNGNQGADKVVRRALGKQLLRIPTYAGLGSCLLFFVSLFVLRMLVTFSHLCSYK